MNDVTKKVIDDLNEYLRSGTEPDEATKREGLEDAWDMEDKLKALPTAV